MEKRDLSERDICTKLITPAILQDFAPFGEVMHKIVNREAKKNYEIDMALYQAITGTEDAKQIFREFPAEFDIYPIETQVTQNGATLKIQPECEVIILRLPSTRLLNRLAIANPV